MSKIVAWVVFVSCVPGCAADSDTSGEATTTGSGGPSSTAEDATSPSSTADATGSGTTPTTFESSTGADASESTTDGVPDPEACRTSVTEADCEAASPTCVWRPAFRVIDVETCSLEPAPDLQCWSRNIEPQMCDLVISPAVCNPLDVNPQYREVDGELQLLDFHCNLGPEDLPSDPPNWVNCGGDEFEPVPPVCYCMCGGPFDPE